MFDLPFRVRMTVRGYELDAQRHVNGSVYVQYADHSRYACVQAAGVPVEELIGNGYGPVNLKTNIQYHHELRGGEDVEVSCDWQWTDGKTFKVVHVFRRPDGEVVAELEHLSGMLDLKTRRLVPNPAEMWRSYAKRPALLGLS
ncbi:acyl-CoA thioester hydrolase [Tamaricihabitans halophyticus]|uniref:Acyl-CoA thioester hydrolase n=1 Tax=Tamaricihabitans halophyticus TaxID=1262583 RepID=A0A4R2R488_9PSEU|nr:acyl-CoA thioesterase [Tamaricihabitans halophyticus]TCP54195.1 acyl-CoA thioester hydrolase [Tamaricihabitans halophyticus]